MRSRRDCEAEMLAALAAHATACECCDDATATAEEAHLLALVTEYDRIPQQREPR